MTYRLTTVLVLSLWAGACADLGRGKAIPAAEVTDATDATSPDGLTEVAPEVDIVAPLSFADGVHTLLLANCTSVGCHGSGAGGFTLAGALEADYAAVLQEVVPGDALASELIKKATNTSSHSGGQVLRAGTSDYELVVAWIDGGADP